MPKFFKKRSGNTFHRFPKLPPELRIKIWTAVLQSRRIIRIDGPHYDQRNIISLPWALLSTNRESRDIAETLVQKAHVHLRFDTDLIEQTIRIAWVPSADIVFIRTKNELASVRVSIVDPLSCQNPITFHPSLFSQDPIQFHACRVSSTHGNTRIRKDHIIMGELGVSDVIGYEEWRDMNFSGNYEDREWDDAYTEKLRCLEDMSKVGLSRGPEWLRVLESWIAKSLKIDRLGDGEVKSAAALELIDHSEKYRKIKKGR